MPLRDHFHRPNGRRPNWTQVHGLWPGVLLQHLNRWLPADYRAAPQIHIGTGEVDLGAFERDDEGVGVGVSGGGIATLPWSPPAPTFRVDDDPPDVDEFALRVYEANEGERLVASVEFVSPGNKDRPEKRRMFVTKCAALLDQGVCVSVVDVVTAHHFNLYADLLDFLGHADPVMGGPPVPHLYAATLRRREATPRWQFETWAHPLAVGQPFHPIPLWLNATSGTLLPLEETYEETCRTVRLPE